MRTLRVQVWSDIACPWCYVGKRRLEAAFEGLPWRDRIAVRWRAFELDPGAPRMQAPGTHYADRLARKYGTSVTQADGMLERMTGVAAAEGLSFRFDRIRPGNTFDAHRLLHLAHERGVQEAVKERLLRAYMTEGEPIGDPEALARLAPQAGLDPEQVREVLDSDRYAAEVRADEEQARELGIRGVPFFVIGDLYGISGAQPAAALHEVLTQAWQETPEQPLADGPACGPDGC